MPLLRQIATHRHTIGIRYLYTTKAINHNFYFKTMNSGTTIWLIIAILPIVILLLRRFLQGPTKGSDNPKKLNGKLVVITGANAGIGKETTKDLAKRGAHIIMCCRDMTKAKIAKDEIQSETGNKNLEILQLDLASLKSVRKCAEILLQKDIPINYLINNAGIMLCPNWKTEEGD